MPNPAAAPDKHPFVQDLEQYLSSATIDATVRNMVTQCLVQQPQEPNGLFMRYLMAQTAELSSADVAMTSSSTTSGACHLALCHEDAETHQYVLDTGLHYALRELMKQVLEEKPEDILEFLVDASKRMMGKPPEELR